LKSILAGAREVAEEAGIHILGGHTIEDNEPKFGMVISGIIHPSKILRNSEAKAGDSIFITKAIGTGILSTAMKKGMTSEETNEELYLSMRELNRKASDVIRDFQITACTDVTGFGLLGHLLEMVKGSGFSAEIYADKVPLLNKVYEYASMDIIPGGTLNNLSYLEKSTKWSTEIDEIMKVILCDAQTSGGLMFTAAPDFEADILAKLHESGIQNAVVIGRFSNNSENPIIHVGR
jgi:selenide,water dikinase